MVRFFDPERRLYARYPRLRRFRGGYATSNSVVEGTLAGPGKVIHELYPRVKRNGLLTLAIPMALLAEAGGFYLQNNQTAEYLFAGVAGVALLTSLRLINERRNRYNHF